jgi:formate dehydrogenase subunit delta
MSQREHLVRMANQIAANFGTMSSLDAAAATADHIATFWDPRMKAGILADAAGLSPVALAAIEILRRDMHPPHQTPATRFGSDGRAGSSDAG